MRSKLLQQATVGATIVPQVVTLTAGAATITGAQVARVNDNGALGLCRSAYVVMQTGLSSSHDMVFTPTVYESDTSGSGDALVTLSGTLPTVTGTSAAGETVGFFLKLDGLKKFVSVKMVAAGTSTETCPISCSIILGDGSVESLPRGTVPTVYAKA